MIRSLDSLLSDILNGTDGKPVDAARAYADQFTHVMKAVATAMTADDPTRLLVADTVMQLAQTVQRSFAPVFAAASDLEVKFHCGMLLLMFGSREPLPWFLAVASTPGPFQINAIRLVGRFYFSAVRGLILDKLRSIPVIDDPRVMGSLTNSDWIGGMLDLWKRTGEPLPDDIHARLHSPEVAREVKLALRGFESKRAESTLTAAVRADRGDATLAPELESIVSSIVNGTGEQRILALDELHKQFAAVVAAAAKTVSPVRERLWIWVADGVVRLGDRVQRAFGPLFATSTDPEVKFLSALILMQFGSRESMPWLLNVASTAGPFQYQATLHLGQLRLPEAQGVILSQLRSLSLSDGDAITGMLDVWKLTGEPLPADVLVRLRSADAATGVKVALDSLGSGLPETTDP